MASAYDIQETNPTGYDNDPTLFRGLTFIFEAPEPDEEAEEEEGVFIECAFAEPGHRNYDSVHNPQWLQDLVEEIAGDFELEVDTDLMENTMMLFFPFNDEDDEEPGEIDPDTLNDFLTRVREAVKEKVG